MAQCKTDWTLLRDMLEPYIREMLVTRGLLSDANTRPVTNNVVSCIRSGRQIDFEHNEGLRDDSPMILGLIAGARAAITSASSG